MLSHHAAFMRRLGVSVETGVRLLHATAPVTGSMGDDDTSVHAIVARIPCWLKEIVVFCEICGTRESDEAELKALLLPGRKLVNGSTPFVQPV